MVRVVESQLVEKPRQLTFNSRFFTFISLWQPHVTYIKSKRCLHKKLFCLTVFSMVTICVQLVGGENFILQRLFLQKALFLRSTLALERCALCVPRIGTRHTRYIYLQSNFSRHHETKTVITLHLVSLEQKLILPFEIRKNENFTFYNTHLQIVYLSSHASSGRLHGETTTLVFSEFMLHVFKCIWTFAFTATMIDLITLQGSSTSIYRLWSYGNRD